jgi:Fe-S-cluster containining protein
MLITVTGGDITRISAALGLGPEETMRALDFYVVATEDETPAGLQGIPSPVTERGSTFIALKKMENGDCVFLKDNLCMIHALRPTACRSFPFVFRESDDGVTWGLSAVKQICPGLGVGSEVSEGELLELSVSVLESIRVYREFIDEWNAESTMTAIDLIRAILSERRFYT